MQCLLALLQPGLAVSVPAGMRLHQAMLGGCVPVIIQEHVLQPWEDVSGTEWIAFCVCSAVVHCSPQHFEMPATWLARQHP